MAILIDFEKVREDSQEVEYIFGYPTMDRRLVIEKGSGQGRPLDGESDHRYTAVYVKVTRYHRDRRAWPEQGVYAA